jgi:NDP-sugar pyrophosphorylase family protein
MPDCGDGRVVRHSGVTVVVPAAGAGTRFGSYASGMRKPLLPLGDGTVLSRILRQAREVTDDVRVAVPEREGRLFATATGVTDVRCVECRVAMGFASTVRVLLSDLPPGRTALVVLGDDVTLGPSYSCVLDPVLAGGAWASQAVVWERDIDSLRQACRVETVRSHMTGIVEKPPDPAPGWRGCGIYGLSPSAVIDLLHDPEHGPGLSEIYARWIELGRQIVAVSVSANVNINVPQDLARAQRLVASVDGVQPLPRIS